ncbi:hypothetical protein GQ607_009534 [Colletotrichum asianum]|uniref:Uncharacterized protein n=1 Tax=Colletotrichum asianum TaxID=702518 RepID=A0A8H3WBM7_9PEZI|nr:hypothetical protein GQ607_009534 [Colletotrichum asianum]
MPITAICLSFCPRIQNRLQHPLLCIVEPPQITPDRSFVTAIQHGWAPACRRHPCRPRPKSGTRCQARGSSVISHFLVVAL